MDAFTRRVAAGPNQMGEARTRRRAAAGGSTAPRSGSAGSGNSPRGSRLSRAASRRQGSLTGGVFA